MSGQVRCEMGEGMGDSKTAKQERTINPDTRLHSDEMRETDEKEAALQEIQGKETSLEASEGSCLGYWSINK